MFLDISGTGAADNAGLEDCARKRRQLLKSSPQRYLRGTSASPRQCKYTDNYRDNRKQGAQELRDHSEYMYLPRHPSERAKMLPPATIPKRTFNQSLELLRTADVTASAVTPDARKS